MWEKILQFGKELLSLKKQTEDNTSEIKEIRQDIKDLTEAVRELASQMQQDRTVEGKKVIDKSDSKERVFNKILEVNNSEERSQWIEFHKVIINHEEQTEEKKSLDKQKCFLNVMICVFFGFGIVIGIAGVGLKKPIVLGVGGFLLGASVFSIVVVPTFKKNE
jgi:hypothetical protein